MRRLSTGEKFIYRSIVGLSITWSLGFAVLSFAGFNASNLFSSGAHRAVRSSYGPSGRIYHK